MESVRHFTVEESFDREALLAEALEIVRYADVLMGSEEQPKELDTRKVQAIKGLQRLAEEQALFSPKLDIHHLTKEDFEERGIEPSYDLKAKIRNNHFYQVNIPVTLFPKSGWAFTRLECWIEFCPSEQDANQRPVIYEIFPEDVWSEIFRFQDQLSLGLDENLAFRAQVENLEGNWKKLSSKAQAKLAVRVGGRAGLVVGPFSYRTRRAKVMSRGRGNVESFWRLDGQDHVDSEDVLLGVVLMVPKSREQPLSAVGELKAYHDFQIWTADLFKDWSQDFPKALKALFGAGVVVSDKKEWQDITRSSR